MKYKSKFWLCEQYILNKKGIHTIARECNVSNGTVENWLKKFDIKTREPKKQKVINYNFLYEQYINKNLSVSEFCDCFGYSKHVVLENLKKYGIKKDKDSIYKGSNNPFYGMKHSGDTKERISKNRKGKTAGKDNPMFNSTHTEEARKRISKAKKEWYSIYENRKYMSNAIKKWWKNEDNKTNHSNWKGGITEEIYGFRARSDLQKTMKEKAEEDGYICQITGKNGGIHVHHLNSVCLYPSQAFDKDNMITINKELHKLFHSRYGYKVNSQDFYNFVNEYLQEEGI